MPDPTSLNLQMTQETGEEYTLMNEEVLTDKQMETVLKMLKEIVESSKDKEDALRKIDKLLKDYE